MAPQEYQYGSQVKNRRLSFLLVILGCTWAAAAFASFKWGPEVISPTPGFIQVPISAILQMVIGIISVIVAVFTLIRTRRGQTAELLEAQRVMLDNHYDRMKKLLRGED